VKKVACGLAQSTTIVGLLHSDPGAANGFVRIESEDKSGHRGMHATALVLDLLFEVFHDRQLELVQSIWT
jgi:hypothetical protein